MKGKKRKILITALSILLILLLIYRDLISYGIMQAKGQYRVLANAKPVEEYLNDPSFPDSLKVKIRFIQEVRQFAIDSLGLKNSDNYTTLFDQQGKSILWNLSASAKYEMKPKEWGFPLLGTFSYKGFFDLERAKEERKELLKEGLDTQIRTVGGWSTLGWFKDPILSNMLNRKDGQLAELIMHELTHATLFVKDSLEFNENLATFVGEKGALRFLHQKYGKESDQVKEYLRSFDDSKSFADHMLRGYKSLDELYRSEAFMNESDTTIKNQFKGNLIKQIVESLDSIDFPTDARFRKVFARRMPNNAYFMAFQRYRAKQNIFDQDFIKIHGSNIKNFIRYYADRYPSL
ncbi:MAG: aminopeptidase [Bacteroidota bacterium]